MEWRKALCNVKQHVYMLSKGYKTVLDHGKSLEKSIGLVVEGAKNVLKNE